MMKRFSTFAPSTVNIGDMAPFASVALDRQDFMSKAEEILSQPAWKLRPVNVPATLCWEARVDDMIEAIDNCL